MYIQIIWIKVVLKICGKPLISYYLLINEFQDYILVNNHPTPIHFADYLDEQYNMMKKYCTVKVINAMDNSFCDKLFKESRP